MFHTESAHIVCSCVCVCVCVTLRSLIRFFAHLFFLSLARPCFLLSFPFVLIHVILGCRCWSAEGVTNETERSRGTDVGGAPLVSKSREVCKRCHSQVAGSASSLPRSL